MPTLEARIKALQRMPKMPRVARRGAKRLSAVAVQRSVVSVAGRLGRLGQAVQVQVALVGPQGRRRDLNVLVSPDGPRLLRRPAARPAVSFVMSEADWIEMASGHAPPAAKYLTGRVRVVGDCRLARQIYRALTKDSSGQVV